MKFYVSLKHKIITKLSFSTISFKQIIFTLSLSLKESLKCSKYSAASNTVHVVCLITRTVSFIMDSKSTSWANGEYLPLLFEN